MLLNLYHPSLQQEKTNITADVVVGGMSHAVADSTGFTTNDYVLIGNYGEERAEIRLISSVADESTIATDALLFNHSVNTQIAKIKYNQIKIYRASTIDGSYSLIATVSIVPNEDFTYYDDTDGTSASYYKIRYYNSTTTAFSSYSDPVQGIGHTSNSLFDMTEEILEEFGTKTNEHIKRDVVRNKLRAGVRKLTLSLIKQFPDYQTNYTTQALTQNTTTYDFPDRFLAFKRIDINFTGSSTTEASKVEMFESESQGYPSTSYSTSYPRVFIRGSQWGIRPTPTSSAGTAFLWYWEYPEEMVTDADEHGLPYGARDPLVAYALYRLWRIKDKDIADMYWLLYKDEMKEWIEFVAQQRQTITNKSVDVVFGNDLYYDDELIY